MKRFQNKSQHFKGCLFAFLRAQYHKRSGFGQGFWTEIGSVCNVVFTLRAKNQEVEALFMDKTPYSLDGFHKGPLRILIAGVLEVSVREVKRAVKRPAIQYSLAPALVSEVPGTK
ncbi:hypothetical protein [Galbibacter mesophilus]|uniref:hypothetical protein n=1 Tax=Galbibacter mesophilus TaxID=379069 RepID=UPI00191DF165|nr:hypothetical protein [Galbibacter mesophilus]MCM5661815.1 hypothetical protein [Galbibacter mesophilus]